MIFAEKLAYFISQESSLLHCSERDKTAVVVSATNGCQFDLFKQMLACPQKFHTEEPVLYHLISESSYMLQLN